MFTKCDLLIYLSMVIFSISFLQMINCEPRKSLPNPMENPRGCKRILSSLVCDPDRLFTNEQVNRIDSILWSHGRSGPCICDQCRIARKGIPVTVGLMEEADVKHVKHFERDRDQKPTFQQFADNLRQEWSIGDCDNDVVIIIATTGGAISLGKVAKKILENSFIMKLTESDFPTTTDEQYTFIINIIKEIHAHDLLKEDPETTIRRETSKSTSEPTFDKNETDSTEKILPITSSGLLTKPSISSSSPTSASSGSNTQRASTFVAFTENDEFEKAEEKQNSSALAFMIVGSLTVILVSLIALFLIIWYYRTKTGNIEPNTISVKPQIDEKTSSDIKSVKYEPCKTEEPGLPV